MYYRRQRGILAILIWVAAGASAPYAIYVFMRFGLVAALWSISLSVLLFATALWCTRINERLNALLETE